MYLKCEELAPALTSKKIIRPLQKVQQEPPILHAAILAKAPVNIIRDIIKWYRYSITKMDSLNRYPIQVAIEEGLKWDQGMKHVVEATAIAQQQNSSVYAAAQYGLKWKYHMKELAELYADEVMNGHDSLMGLRLFMVAAMDDRTSELSSVYGTMRMSPEILNRDTVKRRRLV